MESSCEIYQVIHKNPNQVYENVLNAFITLEREKLCWQHKPLLILSPSRAPSMASKPLLIGYRANRWYGLGHRREQKLQCSSPILWLADLPRQVQPPALLCSRQWLKRCTPAGAEPVLCEIPGTEFDREATYTILGVEQFCAEHGIRILASTRRAANRIGLNCGLLVQSACATFICRVSCKMPALSTCRCSKRMSSRP